MDPKASLVTLGNESGALSDKQRFVKHTIMDEKHRIGSFIPVLGHHATTHPTTMMLFKGNPRNAAHERTYYPPSMDVVFNSSGSVDEQFMLKVFLPFWIRLEGTSPRVRILFLDHHRAHYTPAVAEAFIAARTAVVLLPKSLTWMTQSLDVHVFAQYRAKYAQLVEDVVCKKLKDCRPCAAECRVWTARLAFRAYSAIHASFRFEDNFGALGYLPDQSKVHLRSNRSYVVDQAFRPDSVLEEKTAVWLGRVQEALDAEVVRAAAADVPLSLEDELMRTPTRAPTRAQLKRTRTAVVVTPTGQRSIKQFFTPINPSQPDPQTP